MAYLKWEKEYSVGIAKIDEQHLRLFQYINDLHDAMKNGKSREILSGLIENLVSYTKAHFTLEEQYMIRYNYPDYIQHQKEHNSFANKVTEFRNNYNLTSAIVSIEVMQFLKEWLVTHVLDSDKKYSPFLTSKGIK